MRRAARVLNLVTSVLLLATTAAGGWVAACARPSMVHAHLVMAHAHMAAAHQMMYGAMHHHPTPSRPAPPPLPDDWKECLSMAMGGGSCFGAANAPRLELAADLAGGSDERYPPAAEVRDRLP